MANRFITVFGVAGVLLISAQGSLASTFECDNTVRRAPGGELIVAADAAFRTDANVDGKPLRARSRAYDVHIIRNCLAHQGNYQELTLRYLGDGIAYRGRTIKTFVCATTLKRVQYSRGHWSKWDAIKTLCAEARRGRSGGGSGGSGSAGGSSGGSGDSGSPDDLYDPDYRRRGGGGPDDVWDGDSRVGGGDDFDDLF